MTAEAVNEAQDQTPLADVLEERIELLQTLGLPLEFSSGLLELADNSQNDRERMVILGSLELLLRARQTSPEGKQEPVSYLSRARSLVRIPEVPDDETEEAEIDRRIEQTTHISELEDTPPSKKGLKFLEQLTGIKSFPADFTQREASAFLEELIALYPDLRYKGGRKPAKTFYAEIRLHVQGLKDAEIAERLGQQAKLSILSVRRRSFIETLHTRQYGPEVLAAMLMQNREAQGQQSTDEIPNALPVTEFLDAERLQSFGQRIMEIWGDTDFPLSDPLTEEDALGLISAYSIDKRDYGDTGRFAIRLTRILEGMEYGDIVQLENTEYGELVKADAMSTLWRTNVPAFVVRYLKNLKRGTIPSTPIKPVVLAAESTPDAVSRILETEPIINQPEEAPIAEVEVPIHISTESVPQVVAAPEFFAEMQAETESSDLDDARLQILELQTDGERRHADGSLDAQDVEQVYGVKAKHIRSMAHDIIFRLSSQGKHVKRPSRKRQGGQMTEHYSQAILDILLPEVEKLSQQTDETLYNL